MKTEYYENKQKKNLLNNDSIYSINFFFFFSYCENRIQVRRDLMEKAVNSFNSTKRTKRKHKINQYLFNYVFILT